jgi:hypothetical protein
MYRQIPRVVNLFLMGSVVIKYFLILCYSLTSLNPIYTILRGCLYMDNALTSCLGYFIYLYRTVVKRNDSPLLYIHLEEEEKITKINRLSTLTTLLFIILLLIRLNCWKVIPWSGQTKSDTLVKSNKKWYPGQVKQKVIPWSGQTKSDTLIRSNKKWWQSNIIHNPTSAIN